MSFDLAVWYPHKRMTNQEAVETYSAILNGDARRLHPHLAIDVFYKELCSHYPEIDNVPEEKLNDVNFCPWSIEHRRTDRYIIMKSVMSKSGDVIDLVYKLAMKHGLALFDPQFNKIYYPNVPASKEDENDNSGSSAQNILNQLRKRIRRTPLNRRS